ncbi:hypothetical protein AVEN_19978-1 [Araneus ventricosus]|uniref:ISXO2-like transposase domain-containing protein n=1 Tax=Araneus ventricosus TaxID=182803 RepID=A0A4Y2R8J7_ARAVE|nr:hypothetical protein AVEN_19978-1 [Araneus ventricosus]
MLVNESKEMEMLGGVGVVVKIDESKFGKKNIRVSQWIVSGCLVDLKEEARAFFCVVGDRTAETLIEITKKFVKPGSTVLSDCWGSYNGLTAEGYSLYMNFMYCAIYFSFCMYAMCAKSFSRKDNMKRRMENMETIRIAPAHNAP